MKKRDKTILRKIISETGVLPASFYSAYPNKPPGPRLPSPE
jgi:hypothetical protein